MTQYALRRTLQALPLLLLISMVIFLLLQMTPGGPLSGGEGQTRSSRNNAALEQLREQYGLNSSLPVQYLRWLRGLVKGDWGNSFSSGRPALEVILERLPTTLLLTGSSLVVTLLLVIPIGIIAARKQYSTFDYATTTFSFIGISIPSFWLALMLLFVFSFSLGWLPSGGLSDVRNRAEGFDKVLDTAKHLVLPVATLSLVSVAGLSRYMRASMLEVLHQDYVRTAKAKGLHERSITYKHALRNALPPVVTIVAIELPELFLGSIIIETMFSISGMGRLFYDAAGRSDYPILMGILTIAALLIVVSNLIADLSYGWLDPRIRYA